RVGTADGLFSLNGSTERQVEGHSVSALDRGWAIFDGETVVYETGDGWQQSLTVRSPERSLGVHGALLARRGEAIVRWGSSPAPPSQDGRSGADPRVRAGPRTGRLARGWEPPAIRSLVDRDPSRRAARQRPRGRDPSLDRQRGDVAADHRRRRRRPPGARASA